MAELSESTAAATAQASPRGPLGRYLDGVRRARTPVGKTLRLVGIDPLRLYRAGFALNRTTRRYGLDFEKLWLSLRFAPRFRREMRAYAAMAEGTNFPLRREWLEPILHNFEGTEAGTGGGAFFHMDLWAARRIYERRPASHLDIGSRIDGFITHLLVFMPVTVIDIRPLTSDTPGLTFVQADATNLDRFEDGSVESISSLHAIDGFGLGRYGDPLDPEAWRKALRAIARVLAPGGRFYLGVGIGRERALFNAHLIFSPDTILETLSDLELVSFAAVEGDGLRADARPEDYRDADRVSAMFEFTKR